MERALTSLYLFQGTIQMRSALHIGGGTTNSINTDSPVVRTPDGLPYIPGSSFKGVFRSTVEKLAASLGLDTCLLPNGKDCFHDRLMKKTEKGKTEYDKMYDEIKAKSLSEDDLVAKVMEKLCDTCQLFGNGFSASRIFFSDLYLDSAAWAGVTQVRDGVVIDRDSEKAVEGLKYDFEVVPVGATFRFEIRLENPNNPKDLGLACLGLNEFLSGLGHLGGNRSRGLGNCSMKLEYIYSTDFTNLDQLKRYLLNTDLNEKMKRKDDIQEFINASIKSLMES